MIESLYPHQETGARFLKAHKRGCLFWEVGTGKTNTAIAAVNKLPRGKLLILAPACVIRGMWEKYNDLPIEHEVTFITYEYLARHIDFYKTNRFDYIICDECHKLKNRKSHTFKIVRALTKETRCKYAWGLTGTPYATSFLDIWGIFNSLNIPEFKESYDSFMHMIYICKVVYVNAGRFIYQPEQLKPGMLDILTRRIADHASVLRSQDCIDLPEFSIKEIEVEGMRTQQFIDASKGIINYSDEHQETVNKLAAVQKLHQLSNGFLYTPDHKCLVFKKNAKLQVCEDLVLSELEERDKIIIVYLYEADKQQLMEMLQGVRVSYTTSFDDFCSTQVLLLQEQRAVGVNLQAFTSYMIFYTYSYAYIDYTQTIGRIYRMNQQNKCRIDVLINKHTAERKIWNAVMKSYDIDTLFKGLMVELGEL